MLHAANQTRTNNFVFLKYANQDARLYGIDVSAFSRSPRPPAGTFTASGMLNYVRGLNSQRQGDDLYNIMPLNAKLSVAHQLGNWSKHGGGCSCR